MANEDFGNEIHRIFDGDQLSSLAESMSLSQFRAYLMPILGDQSDLSTRQIENGDYEDIYNSYR